MNVVTDYRQTNAVLDVLCVILCTMLLVYIYLDRRSSDRPEKWFSRMLWSCACMNLGDMPDWLFGGTAGRLENVLIWIGTMMFFISSAALMLAYTGYLISRIERAGTRVSPAVFPVGAALAAVTAFFSVTTPLNHWMFYVSPEDNYYHRGPMFLPTQIATYLIYVVAAYIMIRYRSALGRKEKAFLWSFSALPLCAQLIQMGTYGISLMSVTVTLVLLLVFLFIQSEARMQNELAVQQVAIDHLERQRKLQIELTGQTIMALSNAVEAKDHYTNGHSRRVAEYSREIVRRMGWDEERQRRVYYAGLLHDVGKIRIPDTIINKPERLTDAEYEEMKLHTVAGYNLLKEISSVSEFAVGARWHHERFDGSGYPNGLSGENIPLIARVIGVADAYDAMTSNRSYRRVVSQQKVRREIEKGSGTQFDPEIVRIMLQMIDEDTEYTMHQEESEITRTILAVDDDSLILRQLEHILTGGTIPCSVLTASSGPRALETLRTVPVDLVLLDVEMPRMNGFEVLERIRADFGSLPVIFMTGAREMELIQKAEEIGISDYLTKPPVARVLLACVHNVLAREHLPAAMRS